MINKTFKYEDTDEKYVVKLGDGYLKKIFAKVYSKKMDIDMNTILALNTYITSNKMSKETLDEKITKKDVACFEEAGIDMSGFLNADMTLTPDEEVGIISTACEISKDDVKYNMSAEAWEEIMLYLMTEYGRITKKITEILDENGMVSGETKVVGHSENFQSSPTLNTESSS